MTRRLASLSTLAGAAALALTLAGCGVVAPPTGTDTGTDTETGTDNGNTDISAAPATGVLIEGDGYSYHVPEGWDVPESAAGFDPDTLAADLTDTDGFSDNVNVILSPAGEIGVDDIERISPPELESAGATDVALQPRVTVAGSEAAHVTARFSAQGTTYWVEQYYPTNAGQTYVVTFSFSESLAAGDRVAVAESVLASWSWS
jgi:hypothetical protein